MAKQDCKLTFKPYSKGAKKGRWWKSVDGKRIYFGSGDGKHDHKGRAAAEAKYLAFIKDKHEQKKRQEQADQLRQLSRAFYQGKREAHLDPPDTDGPVMTVQDIVDGALDHWGENTEPTLGDVHFLVHQQNEKRQRESRRQEPEEKTPPPMCINDHIDMWYAAEKQRQKTGQITAKALRSKEQGIKTFRMFAGTKCFASDQQIEKVLAQYRAMLLDKISKGTYTSNTVNDKLKFARQFIKWAYENRVLSELPRNLQQVTKRLSVKKSGQPLSLEDIRKLWQHADPPMRCWIALGLNCGFKNSDIAGLKADDLSNDRIIGRRGKTDVPMNYKLWPATVELIEQTRMDRDQDTGGLLFVNAEGRPVVTESGSDRVGHAFKKLAKQAKVECTFQQLRDTGAQAVKDLMMKAGEYNPALVQLYLAHKDNSTAAFYLSDDPRAMVTKPLDEAIDRVDDFFRLDADQPIAQRQA